MIKLQRLTQTPILTPRPQFEWERGAVFNAGVIEVDGQVHMFYRAVNHEPGGKLGNCRIYHTSVGHAVSGDGLHFERSDRPLIPYGFSGPDQVAEDCRVTRLEGQYYLTYCFHDRNLGTPRPGYSVSNDLRNWEHRGELVPFDDCGFNKNATLFPEKINGRYALLHRPEAMDFRHLPVTQFDWRTWSRSPAMTPAQLPGITLSYSHDLRNWSDNQVIMQPRPECWDNNKVGPGAPPIKTAAGWLNVYHGVDRDHIYRLGIALHDLRDPAIILARQTEAILEPELDWEKDGDVPNVVFTCGALLHGTQLTVYYAGADTCIGVARADIKEFLESSMAPIDSVAASCSAL